MGAGSGGAGTCFIANITGPLIAQGTLTGLFLALLVWAGAGLVGLLLLAILIALLLGLCALCSNALQCGSCDPSCDCGEGSGGSGGGCDGCCGECCPESGQGGGGSGSGGGGGTGGSGNGGGGQGGTGGDGGGAGGGGSGGLAPLGLLGTIAWRASSALDSGAARFAHHPAMPAYAEDVYLVGDVRLCIGCFTTFPLFLGAAAVLFLWQPELAWWAAVGAGAAMASAQAISAIGQARLRTTKAAVKSLLGVGLALYVYGILVSPLAPHLRFVALAGALVLALLSTVPRRRRMRAAGRARGTAGS